MYAPPLGSDLSYLPPTAGFPPAHLEAKMEAPLEKALEVMVNTFHKYSGGDGDKYKLNKSEMRELLLQEMPAFVRGKIDEPGFEYLMKKLDSNEDEELDFQEYAVFLALAASLCNEFFRECSDENNRKR
ncbi:protein S100-A4-like [Eublepharis macularius]|uniref:Protein S100-A4 n=1 Tax=Eublepharis macularius TaxID=481883 RepID=A0AA97KZU1_EUBMA|nr:protein S100-A4-like [Eublepharis macularius]